MPGRTSRAGTERTRPFTPLTTRPCTVTTVTCFFEFLFNPNSSNTLKLRVMSFRSGPVSELSSEEHPAAAAPATSACRPDARRRRGPDPPCAPAVLRCPARPRRGARTPGAGLGFYAEPGKESLPRPQNRLQRQRPRPGTDPVPAPAARPRPPGAAWAPPVRPEAAAPTEPQTAPERPDLGSGEPDRAARERAQIGRGRCRAEARARPARPARAVP